MCFQVTAPTLNGHVLYTWDSAVLVIIYFFVFVFWGFPLIVIAAGGED